MTTDDWRSHFGAALGDWNNPTNSRSAVLILATVPGTSNRRCSAVAGTVQVCDGKYGYNGWLGLATIWIAGGTDHITQGTAKMNDSYFNSSYYGNTNEKQHVICQEIGHTFGLDHQSTDGSSLDTCMDYFSNTGANAGSSLSTKPNAGDFDELLCKYDPNYLNTTLTSGGHSCTGTGHLDSTTTLASSIGSSPAGKGADTEDPNEWGALVSQSANGRSSTYVRHNPDGSVKVTHVYWTIEAAQGCPGCDHRYDH